MFAARPKVAELALSLYSRSLHPELFEVFQSRTLERTGYRVKIDVTSSGHVISWHHDGFTLTEVAASATHPLPQKRCLMACHFRGEQSERVECRGGIVHRCTFQLETVTPEMFWSYQKRLTDDTEHEGLLHCFDPNGRMAIGAISYIHALTRSRQLTVRAFHTFPDDYAIVRTMSEFCLP